MNKAYLISVVIVLSLVFIFSCNKDDSSYSKILYENSFEKDSDTIGWKGYCFTQFVDEGAPGCGDRSIGISCGCIAPYTNFKIGPFDDSYDVVISVWAKSSGNGGGIGLKSSAGEIEIWVDPQETQNWKHFNSKDTLHCPANEEIRFFLFAGGLITGAIQIDKLQVKAVEQ